MIGAARSNGQRAFLQGRPVSTNPYPPDDPLWANEHKAWHRAWNEEHEKAKRQVLAKSEKRR